jgi:hypothetical protein
LELLDSFSNNVARIGPLFNDTRIEVAKPCYALDDKVSYQSVGGIKPVVPSGPLDKRQKRIQRAVVISYWHQDFEHVRGIETFVSQHLFTSHIKGRWAIILC